MFKERSEQYAEDPKGRMLYSEVGRGLSLVIFLVLLGIVVYFLTGD
jgi:hypothetical protein